MNKKRYTFEQWNELVQQCLNETEKSIMKIAKERKITDPKTLYSICRGESYKKFFATLSKATQNALKNKIGSYKPREITTDKITTDKRRRKLVYDWAEYVRTISRIVSSKNNTYLSIGNEFGFSIEKTKYLLRGTMCKPHFNRFKKEFPKTFAELLDKRDNCSTNTRGDNLNYDQWRRVIDTFLTSDYSVAAVAKQLRLAPFTVMSILHGKTYFQFWYKISIKDKETINQKLKESSSKRHRESDLKTVEYIDFNTKTLKKQMQRKEKENPDLYDIAVSPKPVRPVYEQYLLKTINYSTILIPKKEIKELISQIKENGLSKEILEEIIILNQDNTIEIS